MSVPHFAEQGTWTVQTVGLGDQSGDHRSYDATQLAALGSPTTFQQTGASDNTPPVLTAFSFTPTTIDTSAADQTITVTATITDDLSGNEPAPKQRVVPKSMGRTVSTILGDYHRVSGTPQTGQVYSTMSVPHFAEQGTWTVQTVGLGDQSGNHRYYDATQLAALGSPTTFTNRP